VGRRRLDLLLDLRPDYQITALDALCGMDDEGLQVGAAIPLQGPPMQACL
jgi:hypothetical protein